MSNDKSPGPDGYTSEFFKDAWEIIRRDVTVAVQSFFLKGFLPKGLNSTILALIPKKEKAEEMRDYRPISYCNVLYKVIAMIVANQLKGTLWTVKENTQAGSWMWGKILKYRDMAKQLYRVQVKNGKSISFWHNKWSFLGCLLEVIGARGYIDMG